MNKKKAKRRRDISVTFRMNSDEYALLQNKVKESGKMRLEGKEYLMQDGDICHFRFNV